MNNSPNAIRLRRVKPADSAHLHNWLRNHSVAQTLAIRPNISAEEARFWIRSLSRPPNLGFMIVLKETKEPIGIATLHRINTYHGTASTGTIIGDRRHRRGGFGTRAKRFVIRLAFENLKLEVLHSDVQATDDAGQAILKACGYKEVGRIPGWYRGSKGKRIDRVLFQLTKEMWRKQMQE
jgi:RimJ/RimL family protein N-acetyltransferase